MQKNSKESSGNIEVKKQKQKRGLASMSPEKRKRIAKLGAAAVKDRHKFSAEEIKKSHRSRARNKEEKENAKNTGNE